MIIQRTSSILCLATAAASLLAVATATEDPNGTYYGGRHYCPEVSTTTETVYPECPSPTPYDGYPEYLTVYVTVPINQTVTTTTTTTEYNTTTTTTTQYINETITVPTTTTTITTDTATSTYTTTYVTSYPYTVVNNFTQFITTTFTTELTTTFTTSYPVTQTVNITETVPVTLPPEVVTLPGEVTTLPGEVTTLPASTVTTTFTTVLPGVVTTVTLDGTTVVTTLPGVTATVTTTFTEPGTTVTAPGATVTVNEPAICPAPTNSGPVVPQNTGPNALWGCSPGYICNVPKPPGCQLFAEPPAQDYLCDAKYCILAPPFIPVVWPVNETDYYPPPPSGYFDLNPKAFGLDYTIFTKTIIVIYTTIQGTPVLTTITTGDYESQISLTHFPPTPTPKIKARDLIKRDETVIPAVCFASCNNCYLEAQRVGKSPSLCSPSSVFSRYRVACDTCVTANGDTTKRSLQQYFDPKLQEIVGFCDSPGAEPVTVPPTTTTVPGEQLESPTSTVVDVVTETAPPTTPTEAVIVTSKSTTVVGGGAAPTSTTATTTSSKAGAAASTSSSAPPAQFTGSDASSVAPSSMTVLLLTVLLGAVVFG